MSSPPLAGGRLVERCGAWAPTSFSYDAKTMRVVASTCVPVRSCIRWRRRGSRDGWADRQGTWFSRCCSLPPQLVLHLNSTESSARG
eukprot:scaffold484_cov350-Pavlova_lutheri.AAC.1